MAEGRYSPRMIGEGIAGAAAIASMIVSSPATRPWYRKWGATGDEVRRPLPGDELIPHPKSEITGAITIEAPAAQVWPWLVQLGCQRGGWYSYDLLDNGGVPSAERIIPEYQHLEVGDAVPFTTDGKMGFPVAAIDPGRALILGGMLDTRTGEPADPGDPNLEEYFGGAIILYLDEVDPQTTRLVFRQRLDWNPGLLMTLIYGGFLEPISFVMARKMLKRIRQLAEGA